MKDNIFQCCYTNSERNVGGRTTSGWGTVACSKNIPPEALKQCERLQKANSRSSGGKTDEEGNILNLLEIYGENKFVYVLRTQYGLEDREGRANMFSHAYILLWSDVLSDPNALLKITDQSNFRSSEAEAQRLLDEPDWEPGASYEGYTIERAMREAGISEETYPVLIRCVYAQLSGYTKEKPVYIYYKEKEQIPAILFCIYYGLPYHLRKKLYIASAPSGTPDKKIFFSRSMDRSLCYIDPQTGDNTILTDRLQLQIKKYGFIDYAAAHLDDPDYFARLREKAASLGDKDASNDHLLKIAHREVLEEPASSYTKDELKEFIGDALRSKAYESCAMMEYIEKILRRIKEEKLRLPNEYMVLLLSWRAPAVLSQAELEEKRQLENEQKSKVDAQKEEIAKRVDSKYKECEDINREAVYDRMMINHIGGFGEKFNDCIIKKTSELKSEYEEVREQVDGDGKRIDELVGALPEDSYKSAEGTLQNLKEMNTQITDAKTSLENMAVRIAALVQIMDAMKEAVENFESYIRAKQDEITKNMEKSFASRKKSAKRDQERKKGAELAKEYAELEDEIEKTPPPELKRLKAKAALADEIKQYITAFLREMMSSDEAVSEIAKLSEDNFEQCISLLEQSEEGQLVLIDYFTSQLQEQSHSWESLDTILRKAGSWVATSNKHTLLDKIRISAHDLYKSLLKEDIKNAPEAYSEYLKIVKPLMSIQHDHFSYERYQKEAKRDFWDMVSLTDCPLSGVCGEFKNTGAPREKMFQSLGFIINNAAQAVESEILKRTQQFFADYRRELQDGEYEQALHLICDSADKQNGGGRTPYFVDWIELASQSEAAQYEGILSVKTALDNGPEYGSFLLNRKKFLAYKPKKADGIIQRIDELAFKICCEADSSDAPVPLDVWLTLGESLLREDENIFSIFDRAEFSEKSAEILKCDSFTAVSGSELFEKYQKAADSYVAGHGKEFKAVNDWLKQLKKSGNSGPMKKLFEGR